MRMLVIFVQVLAAGTMKTFFASRSYSECVIALSARGSVGVKSNTSLAPPLDSVAEYLAVPGQAKRTSGPPDDKGTRASWQQSFPFKLAVQTGLNHGL